MNALQSQSSTNAVVFTSKDLPFELKGYAIFRVTPTQLVIVCKPPFLRIDEPYLMEFGSQPARTSSMQRPARIVEAYGLTDTGTGLMQIMLRLRYWAESGMDTDSDMDKLVRLHRFNKAAEPILGRVHVASDKGALISIVYDALKPGSTGLLTHEDADQRCTIEKAYVDKNHAGQPELHLVLSVGDASIYPITPRENLPDDDSMIFTQPAEANVIPTDHPRRSLFSIPPEDHASSAQTDLVYEEEIPQKATPQKTISTLPPCRPEPDLDADEDSRTAYENKLIQGSSKAMTRGVAEPDPFMDSAPKPAARSKHLRWLVATITILLGLFVLAAIVMRQGTQKQTVAEVEYESIYIPMTQKNLKGFFHQDDMDCFRGTIDHDPKPGYLGIICSKAPPVDELRKCANLHACSIQLPDGESALPGEHQMTDELVKRWFHQQSASSYIEPSYPFPVDLKTYGDELHVNIVADTPFDPVSVSFDVTGTSMFVPMYDSFPSATQ